MNQVGRLVRGLVQLEHPGEHCRKVHVLGFPTVKDSVKNICGKISWHIREKVFARVREHPEQDLHWSTCMDPQDPGVTGRQSVDRMDNIVQICIRLLTGGCGYPATL
jgi:hypothetical protein